MFEASCPLFGDWLALDTILKKSAKQNFNKKHKAHASITPVDVTRVENGDSRENISYFPRLQTVPAGANMGGRPAGATNETKKDLERWKVATTNLMTQQIKEERDTGTLSTCSYKENHDKALEFHLLLDSGFAVKNTTVIRRI